METFEPNTTTRKDAAMLRPKLVAVTPTANHRLLLEYENGERKIFDVTPLLSRRQWKSLSDESKFMNARLFAGTVVWDDKTDAPERLYEDSTTLQQSQEY